MSRPSVALAMLVLLALTGCGESPTDPGASSRAHSLWSSRAPYVGDAARVAALVREVGPAPEAGYSISLETETTPYALTIELQRLGKPFTDTDFSEPATLLLGLVANLDEVTLTSSGHAYSLTAAAASKDLGYDVKELGRDRTRLTAYLDENSD